MVGARMLVVMALMAGLAACSKKEQSAAPKVSATEEKTAAGQVTGAGATGVVQAAEAAAAEGADLGKVEKRTGDFQDMLDFMHTSAGDKSEINANRLDIESFVQGKSDQKLMEFVKAMKDKSPFAVMQVLTWLLKNSEDSQILLEASSWFLALLPEFGSEEDRSRAMGTLDMLKQMYAESEFSTRLSAEDRDRLLTVAENHLVLLGLDSEAWQQLADHVRKFAKSDLDLSYADSIESGAIIRRGQTSEAARLRGLHQSIIDRGVYGKRVTPEPSQYWLSLNDKELEEALKMGAERTSLSREHRMDVWLYLSGLPEDDRLKAINDARKQNKE